MIHPILDRIIKNANDKPSDVAIRLADRNITYKNLEDLIRRFTFEFLLIKENGEPLVLIDLEKSEFAYAAMLATWGSGGFYTPINTSLPKNRVDYISNKFSPDIIVTSVINKHVYSKCGSKVVYIELLGHQKIIDFFPKNNTSYVIFTSGSTGVPKGVEISTIGLVNYIKWAVKELNIHRSDICSQHPNIGFDLSVIDIFSPLYAGSSFVPFLDYADKIAPGLKIKKYNITIWVSVPSVINVINAAKHMNLDYLGSLKTMFFCGEPLLPSHLDIIFNKLKNLRIINAYGPTECTVSCTAISITRDNYKKHTAPSVSIGKAIDNMELFLDNKRSKIKEGEIIVCGPQVALGYWNDKHSTIEKFVTINGSHCYKTGDWGEAYKGDIYFKHRLDRQCKVSGHRVDSEEIDKLIYDFCNCKSYTIVVNNDLISYIESESINQPMILEYLSCNLPPYCVPKYMRTVDVLPKNNNDKIDEKKLIDMV